jgi:radical SAM-linked protein
MVRQRVRIRFRKQGDLRLIGHRDLVRTMERLFRRAGLRLAMSEGFHPKPRMSFPSALALGIAGVDEVMELELAEPSETDELLRRLAPQAPPGLALESAESLPPGTPKARLRSATFQVPIPEDRRAETAQRVAELLASPSLPILRPGRSRPIDLRRSLQELELSGGVLRMRLLAGREATPGPRDVLAALGLADLEQQGTRITRTRVELEP